MRSSLIEISSFFFFPHSLALLWNKKIILNNLVSGAFFLGMRALEVTGSMDSVLILMFGLSSYYDHCRSYVLLLLVSSFP